jgi:predicted lipoprotein with Yx(FWY)xxD motif
MRLGAFAATLALAASLAAVALAAGSSMSIGSAPNAKLGEQVLVNPQDRTLYALSPETAGHLLCKARCLSFWPPLTVRSRSVKLKAGTGVQGHLGLVRRHNGMLQVTLAGRPLYRYAGDHAKGDANGQEIHSFGGIWHAVTASTTPSTTTPTVPGAPSPPAYPSQPGY